MANFDVDSNDYSDTLQRTLANPVIVRLNSALQHRVPSDAPILPESKLAAVLALVRMTGEREANAELLFIKRATLTGDPWSGHIAFPGGRHDLLDDSLADTALRETREELTLDVARHGKLIGRLDDLAPLTPSLPPIIIRPFVGVVPAAVCITPNDEVAEAFWVSVAALRLRAARKEHAVTRNHQTMLFPSYRIREHVIWGLTERIVSQLLPLFGGAND